MRIITITMLSLLSTTIQAKDTNLDVRANVEGGCTYTLSTDKVNFNSADYEPTDDTLGGKSKIIDLSVNCSNGIRYKVQTKDLNTNTNNPFFELKHVEEDNNSKFTYSVTSGGNNVYALPISRISSGKPIVHELNVSVSRSSYNPEAGDYAGGFELVFTH